MRVSTLHCSRVAHPEIVIQFDEPMVITSDARAFVTGLEEEVLSGRRFKDGETLQVGWSLALFRAAQPDVLAVWEPDMESFPMRFVDSVSRTLMHLRLQRDVAESLSLSPRFPSMRESGMRCSWAHEPSSLVMERFEPEGASSGWFIHCGSPSHDHENAENLVRESLYAIALDQPGVISYLALPPGSVVLLKDSVPESISVNGAPLVAKKGSYLDARIGRI